MLSDGVGDSGTQNLLAQLVDTCQSLQNKTKQKKTKPTKQKNPPSDGIILVAHKMLLTNYFLLMLANCVL